MYNKLFKKIPKNTEKIAIYGYGTCAKAIKENLKKYNDKIEILCYIDSNIEQNGEDLIIKPNELEKIKDKIDLMIISTKTRLHEIIALMDYYSIRYLIIPDELDSFIRKQRYIENYKKALKIFKDKKDKKLYEMIWNARFSNDYSKIAKYSKKYHDISKTGKVRNYNKHYLEFINKNKIETILDCGFCNGIHSLGFKKNLLNLKKDWAFEPLYNELKDDIYDDIIKKADFVEIVPYAVWDKKDKLKITLNNSASKIIANNQITKFKEKTINAISIDEYCKKHKIDKVDFIKMDIEGSELNGLRGGGIQF